MVRRQRARRATSPVTVIDRQARAACVVVPDFSCPAIGRRAERLAGGPAGWRIDIRSDAAVDASWDQAGPGAQLRRTARRMTTRPVDTR